MYRSRVPVAVIYACGSVTATLILVLLAYDGVFDGALDTLIENLKDIARFFSQ